MLKLTQGFIRSPEPLCDGAALVLIANSVLPTPKSVDGGSPKGQTDASGICHPYDCQLPNT